MLIVNCSKEEETNWEEKQNGVKKTREKSREENKKEEEKKMEEKGALALSY